MPSDVLEFVREQDKKLRDVPDEELTLFLAEKHPDLLQDPDFSKDYFMASEMGQPAIPMTSLAPPKFFKPQTPPPEIPGNIDLEHRPGVLMPDGSMATVRSTGVNIDGLEYLLPTAADGKILTNDEAIERFKRTGEHLGAFKTVEQANEAAKAIHESEARRIQWQPPTPSPEQRQEYQTELNGLAARLKTVYEAQKGMSGDDPMKLAQAKANYIDGLRAIGIEPVSELKDPVQLVGEAAGPALARGGKFLGATAGDVTEWLSRVPNARGPYPMYGADESYFPNLEAFAQNPDERLPIEEDLSKMPGWARYPGKAEQFLAHTLPRIGTAAMLGPEGLGFSTTLANVGAMGFDEQGNVDPVGVLAAVGLPFTDKFGRQLAASAIQRMLARPIILNSAEEAAAKIAAHYPWLQKEGTQRALEFGAGQLMNNAYLLALQTPGILQSDNPTLALEDAVLSNLALSLMGAGELTGGRSRTMTELGERIRRGEPILNVQVRPPEPPQTTREMGPLPTKEVTPNAQPDTQTAQPNVPVQQPGGAGQGAGQVPADQGGAGVPAGGQGQVPAQGGTTPDVTAGAGAAPPAPAPAPAPAPTPEEEKVQTIETAFKQMGQSGAQAFREKMIKDFKEGKEIRFTKPLSIELARKDPTLVLRDNPDGSVTVIDIKEPAPAPPVAPPAPAPAPAQQQGEVPTLEEALAHPGNKIADHVRTTLTAGGKPTAAEVRTMGESLGLSPREAEEWAELGGTEVARDIAQNPEMTPVEKYWALVNLYDRMPGAGERTVESKVAQQYSTPPPLAWVASLLADVHMGDIFVDPTAGHGMLSIGAKRAVALNELDKNRLMRLRRFLGPNSPTRGLASADATSEEFQTGLAQVQPDRLGMNPPFGNVMDETGKPRQFTVRGAKVDKKTTSSIDTAIVLNSLEGMASHGKAFAIIGAKTGTPFGGKFGTDAERARAYRRPLFLDLFNRFNVVDWFTIGGDLYRKMGAAWPVDVIIVHGKGATAPSAVGGMVRPWVKPPRVIESWEELAKLIPDYGKQQEPPTGPAGPSGGGTGTAGGGTGGAGGGAGGGATGGPREPPLHPERPKQPPASGGDGGGGVPGATERPNPTPPPPAGVPGDSGTGIGTGTTKPPKDVAGGGAAPKPPAEGGVGGEGPVVTGPSPPESSGLEGWPKFLLDYWGGTRERMGKDFSAAGTAFRDDRIKLANLTKGKIQQAIRSALAAGVSEEFIIERSKFTATKLAYEDILAETKRLSEAKAPPPPPSVPVEGLPESLMVPYVGVSKGPSLNLVAPRNIATQMRQALLDLEAEVGMPIDEYVAHKLDRDVATLHTQLAGAQVDAVALAIRNIEAGKALITADETGVGKGRVVAAIIEYATARGLIPVFITAKKNLYSDMAGRDLPAVGNKDFVPFITNTDAYYEDGHGREHKQTRSGAQMTDMMNQAANTGVLPGGAQGVFTTYDQLKADRPKGFKETPREKAARKRQRQERPDGPRWNMLRKLAPKAIFIMDEAHLAAGLASELNLKFGSVLPNAKGMYFSSATFAKRPDNLGLYALGTSMKLSGLNSDELTEALTKGGVPLQQALTSMLAASGELVRRQQDWGANAQGPAVKFNFKSTSADPAAEIEAADTYTSFIRDLMQLAKQVNRAATAIQDNDNQVRAEEVAVSIEPITFGSRLFNLSNQYLLSLRSEAIVSEAVRELKAGRKPFIALYNTMEGPITDLKAMGLPLSFAGILRREMIKMLKLRVRDPLAEGGRREHELEPEDLPDGGEFFRKMEQQIDATDFGRFPISPIDYIKRGIEAAGFRVGELTARDGEVDDTGEEVVITKREKQNRNKILKAYNDGDLDAIIVNGAGSTGLSAHTDPRFKDKRQRVMIVGQPAPDINEFMQMLGRIMRSGQISKPEYIILTTALAAERRFATMLRGKMTSLNANTTAEGESGMTQAEGFADDIFNQVGDGVVSRVMEANQDLAQLMEVVAEETDGFARQATGRFVLLPNADAHRLWNEIIEEFKAEVERLDELGQNPLRAVAEDLRARTMSTQVAVEGTGKTPFDGPALLETATVRPPRAPPTHAESVQAARDNIAVVRDAAGKWIEGSHRAERERLDTAIARGATHDQLERIRQTFQNVRVAVTELYRKVGDTFGLDMLGDGTTSFYGVAVDLKLAGGSVSDYASASRQQLVLRTNTYKGRLTLPISKLYTRDGVEVEPKLLQAVDEDSAPEKFDGTAENQTTRNIVTGNLLRGWDYADNNARGKDTGRPRVAIYTRADGTLSTGILMPPGWEPRTAQGQVPVGTAQEFVTAYQQQVPMRSTPNSAVHPVQVVAGRLVVPSKNQAKPLWGDPAFGQFFQTTPRQLEGNFVGIIAPRMAGPLFEFLSSKGVRMVIKEPEQPAASRGPGRRERGGAPGEMSVGAYISGVKGKPGQLPPTVTYGGMNLVYPLEMPEIIRLVQDLTGYVPKVKLFRGATSGEFGDGMITIDRRIFKTPGLAAQVILHEIGHAADYFPHETLKRGNLLGHLLALHRFMRETWGNLSNKDLRAELIEVSKWWRPYDPVNDPPSYVKYRESARELYADAFSVMFNAPSELQARAPKFYKAFWENIDRRPPVKDALFSMLRLLSTGKVAVLEKRAQESEEMFFRGDEIFKRKVAEREARRRSFKGWWLELEQAFHDVFAPIIQKVIAAEKAGVNFAPSNDPRNIIEEARMVDNDNSRLLRRIFETVIQPIEDAGISVTQYGRYLMLRRIQAGDKGIPWPKGQTPETARIGLMKMRLDFGIDAMTRMERADKMFHDIVFEAVEEGVRVGSYNKQVFETTLKPNRDVYAAFAKLKHLQDFVPAGLKKLMGDFDEIANPFLSTVLKMISLNNLNAMQRMKNTTRDLLLNHFRGEIEEFQGKFIAPGVFTEPPPRADKGVLSMLENGRRAYYYVDPIIARVFERLTARQINPFLRVLDFVFRKIFYRSYITYSPSFLFFNPMRDFKRTWKNLPQGVSRWRLAKAYYDAFSEAVAHVRGMPGPLAREMMATYALGTPMESMASSHRSDPFADLMRRFHMLPDEQQWAFWDTVWGKPLRAVARGMEFFGQLQETLPKMAAYLITRKQLGMPVQPAAHHVRNFSGTPNVRKSGTAVQTMRALFPFYNVILQSWAADIKKMKPKSKSGWWFKWAISDGWFAIFTALASAGLLGLWLKELFGGISEYDKSNHNSIPVGTRKGGMFGRATTYLRFARDESSRLVSGVVYKVVRMLAGQSPESVSDLFEFGGGQVPTVNPAIKIPAYWAWAAAGGNPPDIFRGRPVMPKREYEAGGWHVAGSMARWTMHESGVDNWVAWNPNAETTTELVVSAIPGLKSFVKTSDFGYMEEQKAKMDAKEQARYQHLLGLPSNAQSLSLEWAALKNIDTHLRTAEQQTRYNRLNIWYNSVYRKEEEQIWNAMAAKNKAMADSARKILEIQSKPYEKTRR